MPFSLHLAALPWENVVFIIIFLIVGVFQWVAQEAAKRKKSQRSSDVTKPSRPAPVSREETDTERIRRFLEALGQPPDAKPPPAQPRPAAPRTITPRQRPLGSPLPPLTTVPPDLPSPVPEAPPLPQVRSAPVMTTPPPPAPTAPPALPIAGQEIARTTATVVAFPEAQTLAAHSGGFRLAQIAERFAQRHRPARNLRPAAQFTAVRFDLRADGQRRELRYLRSMPWNPPAAGGIGSDETNFSLRDAIVRLYYAMRVTQTA